MRRLGEAREYRLSWFVVGEIVAWASYLLLKSAFQVESAGAKLALGFGVGLLAMVVVIRLHRVSG